MPLRNGGKYLKECINSILLQTRTDYNIIILDNLSTDGSVEWLRSLQNDKIIIHTSTKSLEIEENWNRVLSVEKNEFMTLIGHDDILLPDYLETIDALIVAFPDASLYQTHFDYIDDRGVKIRTCKPMPEMEKGPQLLASFLQNKLDLMGTGFMMRSKDYDLLGGIPDYPNLLYADLEIFMELTMQSYKVTSPKITFYFRIHQSTTTVSPNIKFLLALGRVVSYMSELGYEDLYAVVIRKHGKQFLLKNCKALCHRLLRSPVRTRNRLSVRMIVNRCKVYGHLLIPGVTFIPEYHFSVFLSLVIDGSEYGRNSFLWFKRHYKKPLLK